MHVRFPLVLLCLFAPLAATDLLPPPVARMYGLFDHLRSGLPVSVRLPDTEINDYLVHSAKLTPRPGVDSVSVKVFPNNYLSTFTVIDFDAVEKWKPGTIPTILRPVLSGKKSIWVDLRFRAENGAATFTVEKAYFQKMPLPAAVVQKMAEIVAARQPEQYDLTKPVPIPFGLRRVWTEGNVLRGEK
jgi:hypothetical protein